MNHSLLYTLRIQIYWQCAADNDFSEDTFAPEDLKILKIIKRQHQMHQTQQI